MHVLKEYKNIFAAGLAVVLFFAAAYFVVGNVETKSKFSYAEHIFQENTVNEIDIAIDEADWQDMLENPLEEAYHKANVTINGELIGNAAIRTKGNTSLTSVANSDSDRYSFKIDFDYYDDNGNYYGLRKLCLNNNYADNSSMREYIGYKIMGELGIPVPGCGYSHITVNGEEWGLYLAVEPIDEVFLQTRFGDATGDLYKPEGMGGTGADLVYCGDDISQYTGLNLKTNLETSDGSEIIALMQALESGEGLEEVLDIENALKYIAANVALANFDSYLGGTTHNYYLYEENGMFSVIPWDINLAFGGFGGGEVDIYEPASNAMGGGRGEKREERVQSAENETETSAADRAEMTAENGTKMPAKDRTEPPDMGAMPENGNMPQMPNGMFSMGGSDGKPLADTLLADETLLSLYEGYLQEIAEKYLTEEYMAELVTEIHDLIAPYVERDATAFYTYAEFEQACSIDPEDTYSLVYYAVNMSESILNQLSGGEPTFDTSSLQGGGMHMGGKGGGMPAFSGEMPAGGNMPEMGNMPSFGGQMPEMGNMPAVGDAAAEQQTPPGRPEQQEEQNAEERPAFGNGRGGRGGRPEGMGGVPGERGQQPIDIKEVLPELAVCGGVFAAGLLFALVYKRKKDL
ncbi:MAG: CotH kinase family protein [Anaerotignum sp.]|nr:CotH kinase family protein [Anaerotignum sp.]